MKIYDIWTEGYVVTGQSGQARFVGRCAGKDFKDACRTFFTPAKQRDWGTLSLEGQPSVWGCRLFDNEAAARESFG